MTRSMRGRLSRLAPLLVSAALCAGCMPFAVGTVGPMPPSRQDEDGATSKWEACMSQAKVRAIDEPGMPPSPAIEEKAREACSTEESVARRTARGADGPGGDTEWARLHLKTADFIYEIRYERASRAVANPGDAVWDGVSRPLTRAEFEAGVLRWDDCLMKAARFFAAGNQHDLPVELAQAARRYCSRKETALEFDSVQPPLAPGDADAVSAFIAKHALEQTAVLTVFAEEEEARSRQRK